MYKFLCLCYNIKNNVFIFLKGNISEESVKRKILAFLVLISFSVAMFSSCGGNRNVFEKFFGSLKKLDFISTKEYLTEDSLDYTEALSSYASVLSEEQRDTAVSLLELISFAYSSDNDDDGTIIIDLTYVDFSALVKDVNGLIAIGDKSATYYINEMLQSGRISVQYVKTVSSLTVNVVSDGKEVKIPFGYSGENEDFTGYIGLDTFLRWYSGQR